MDKKELSSLLIVGAGVMGSSIAQSIAMGDRSVTLVDVDQKVLDRAMMLIESGLKTMADFGKIPGDRIPSMLGRIQTSTDLAGMAAKADFVIEAVSEVPEIKKEVFLQLGRSCPEDTAIASNTSGLNIFKLADIPRPERLIIAHFFAPAHIIPFVEIVPGDATSLARSSLTALRPKDETSFETISLTARLMERLGKKTVVMKKFGPGFIVNRIQKAIGEACFDMIDEGLAGPEEIDRAVKLTLGIRLPVIGVMQSFDFQGLDMLLDTMKNYGKVYSFVEERVNMGHLGVKTSKGIYDYKDRSESEILKKRDENFLKMIDYLKDLKAFDPL